jgi:ABC-2 type transport system permease protein
MFGHLYFYRLKVLLRNKSLLFWTLLFPIILGLMFSIAFSNIDQAGTLESIEVGIVGEQTSESNQEQEVKKAAFIDVLKQAKTEDTTLFSLKEVDEQAAKKEIESGKLAAYFTFENASIQMNVARTGISQTILQDVMNQFLQKIDMTGNLTTMDATLSEEQLASFLTTGSFIQERKQSENMSLKSFYFFTLMGMTILYGFMWGMRNAQDQQANQSSKGIRLSVMPQSRLLVFSANMLAGFSVFFAEVLIILGVFRFVLQIDFGQRWQWMLVVAALGALNAILLGNLLGNLFPNIGIDQKEGLGIAVTMAMSFFAGMMGSQEIKYWIDQHIPLLGKLNVVNLISESFYQLYYYQSLATLYTNLLWLFALMLVLIVGNLFFERRVQYVSV